jgi:rhodanese-related sulfurtransferase
VIPDTGSEKQIETMKEETSMTVSIMDKVAAAKGVVPAISPKDVQAMIGRSDVLLVDVRDAPELSQTGKIKDAVHVSRGMLEFRADEKTPYHNGAFTRDKTIVLYCASGGRSALAGKALMEMGYTKIFNLGAFKDWVEAGGPVEQV